MRDLDHRYLARDRGQWWESINEKNHTLIISVPCGEECECGGGYCDRLVELPFRYKVCPTCDGKGKHVNPDIDSHGISAEEFVEDPDFEEDYRRGIYNVPCYECGGIRVVPEIDEEQLNDEQGECLELLRQREYNDVEYARMCAMERMMGA